MRAPSTTLSALFGVALLGVLLAGGLLAAMAGGMPALLAYAAVAGLLVCLGIARMRRLLAASAPPPPGPCTCCDGDHTKPVTIV